MSADEQVTVRENDSKSQFEVTVDGHDAYVTFTRDDHAITFDHTFVPPALEGRGIAGQLAKHGLEYAREHGLAVVPQCPYIRSYIERHPEYQDLVEK